MDENRKKHFQVIPGGFPKESQMKREIPVLLDNIKRKLKLLKDVETLEIQTVKDIVKYTENVLGSDMRRYLYNK